MLYSIPYYTYVLGSSHINGHVICFFRTSKQEKKTSSWLSFLFQVFEVICMTTFQSTQSHPSSWLFPGGVRPVVPA